MSIFILTFLLFQLYPQTTFSIIKIVFGVIKKINFFLLYYIFGLLK